MEPNAPEASLGADPDGDERSNEVQFLAPTLPNDSQSAWDLTSQVVGGPLHWIPDDLWSSDAYRGEYRRGDMGSMARPKQQAILRFWFGIHGEHDPISGLDEMVVSLRLISR